MSYRRFMVLVGALYAREDSLWAAVQRDAPDTPGTPGDGGRRLTVTADKTELLAANVAAIRTSEAVDR